MKETCFETEAQGKVTWKWPIELNSNFIQNELILLQSYVTRNITTNTGQVVIQ